ncbi:MAG: SDR family NAD(P)-dependent oxidoreductase [Burkholderiales bacterium]
MSIDPLRLRLAGKLALITGAAGGIGAATAELFCAEGAKVLLVDRDAAQLAECVAMIRIGQPQATVEAFVADIAVPDQAAGAVARACTLFGGLNVLVNNAAVRYVAPVATADPAQWEAVFAVNVLGAVNCCKVAIPALRAAGGAAIVNVSSAYAAIGRKHFGAYDAAKSGLLALTRTLAHEEAEHGVRVNAVCPGGTLTPFTIGRAASRGLTEAALRAQPNPDTLLARWAEAHEIAYPILWLASDEASFVTGASLMVDGGTSIK